VQFRSTFQRVSPASFAERNGIPLGWFVISHRWVEPKLERRRYHGKWFKLSSELGSVYRVLRFSARLAGAPGKLGDIVIDYPAWLDLHGRAENVEGPLELRFEPARWWQVYSLATSHPDPSFRLAGWLATLSVALGIVSVALAIWSLWKTYFPH
jgi:hypothetical protein